MVSILGEYNYTFPKPKPLTIELKDILEKKVDEKYYLSSAMIKYLTSSVSSGGIDRSESFNRIQEKIQEEGIAATITTNAGNRATDNFINETLMKTMLCNKLIQDGLVEEGDVVKHSYTQQILDGGKKCVEKNDGNMNTLTTRGDCVGITVRDEPKVIAGIGEKKSNGGRQFYQQDRVYDNNVAITLATSFNPYYVVDEKNTSFIGEHYKNFIDKNGYIPQMFNAYNEMEINEIAPTQTSECGNTGSSAAVLIKDDGKTNESNLRIRKLTPKECFRLMGVKDEDFEKAQRNQSDSALYHLAGDSIVTNVLMAIFKEML